MKLKTWISNKINFIEEHEYLKLFVFLFFIVFYLVVFVHRAEGAGQYWDSVFPYYKEQISNYFHLQSSTWIGTVGYPLKYSSDYYFRFLVSQITFLNPEWLFYLLHVLLFSLGSYGIFISTKNHQSTSQSVLFSLAVFMLPAIFCITIAGYVNDVVSLVILIYFVNYLLNHFKASLKSYVVVALFFSFIGVAIQFFVLTAFTVLIFFILYWDLFKVKFLPILFGLPLLLNLPWLTNVLVGGDSVQAISQAASKTQNLVRTASSLLRIFNFSYSPTTLIERYYPSFALLLFLLVFVYIYYCFVRFKPNRISIFFSSNLFFFIFLGTGAYRNYPVWPIDVLYPMFREMQHTIPFISLFLILLWAQTAKKHSYVTKIVLLAIIVFGARMNLKFSNAINFSLIRNEFSEFENFIQNNNSIFNVHVMTYPFFGQYGFKNIPVQKKGSFRLNNTGYDSFMAYSGLAYIENAMSPYKVHDSIQYKLLKTGRVENILPFNVGYIFDFSDIYESFYNQYVPADTYDYDVGLIKNNVKFFTNLIRENPSGIKQVSSHVYQLLNVRDYISSFIQTFNLNNNLDPSATSLFAGNIFQTPLYSIESTSNSTEFVAPTQVYDLFGSITGSTSSTFIDSSALDQDRTSLYVNSSKEEVAAVLSGSSIKIYKKSQGKVFVNGELIISQNNTNEILVEQPVQLNKVYYISAGDSVHLLQKNQDIILGEYSDLNGKIDIYASQGGNIIPNASFENGSWQADVGDCSAYDNNSDIAMSLNKSQKTHGRQSLQLEAARHTACISGKIPVQSPGVYLFAFDFQSPNTNRAGYNIQFNDPVKTVYHDIIPIENSSWQTHSSLLDVPENATNATLHIYAYPSNKKIGNIDRYDNFRLEKVEFIKNIQLKNVGFQKIPIHITQGENIFEFNKSDLSLKNIILNPSFEDGSWTDKVGDCHNYDSNPVIGMNSNDEVRSEGGRSLQLEATRHNACTSQTLPITGGGTYLFSFDYQTSNQSISSYYVGFNDSQKTFIRENLSSLSTDWNSFSKLIKVPQDANTVTIYVYANESDGYAKNINRYDNFKLIKVPDLRDAFYLVSEPQQNLVQPSSTQFELLNPTKKLVHIKGATTSFFLGMSENYNGKWQAQFDNAKIHGIVNSWWPFAKPDRIDDAFHYKLDGFLNAWYVDVPQYCHSQNLCHANADGSYDIDMVIEFWPQRWFYLGLLVSGTTLTGCISYLVYEGIRSYRKKRRAEKTRL